VRYTSHLHVVLPDMQAPAEQTWSSLDNRSRMGVKFYIVFMSIYLHCVHMPRFLGLRKTLPCLDGILYNVVTLYRDHEDLGLG